MENSNKPIRKMVTLPPDLAERVDRFREKQGSISESEAIRMLIEDGLRMRDKPEDLYLRCIAMTRSGGTIGDLINFVTADHPLVQATNLDADTLMVYLRVGYDRASERFVLARERRLWCWEIHKGNEQWWDAETAPVVEGTEAFERRRARALEDPFGDDKPPF